MEISDIRLGNFRFFADKLGRSALADKMGYPDTVYINQVYTQKAPCGSRTCRKLEIALGLERGYMDVCHDETLSSGRLGALAAVVSDFTSEEIRELAEYAKIIKKRKTGGF